MKARLAAACVAVSMVCGVGSVCGACGAPQEAPRAPTPLANGWSFEVRAAPGGERLVIDGDFPPGSPTTFEIEGDARFVHDVDVRAGSGRGRVEASGDRLTIRSCESGCRVSYVYELRAAAEASPDMWTAERHGSAIQSPPSAWLLHPTELPGPTPFRVHVTSAPGDAFATGLSSVAGVADVYEGSAGRRFDTPFAMFGRFRRVTAAGGHVEVALPEAFHDERAVLDWITRSAGVVEAFYGAPPVPRVLVLLVPTGGSSVGAATTMGSSGASIQVEVGRDATSESLRDDWVLVHEMVHTALPNVSRAHHWLEEGLATYVEPVARVQAGLLTPEAVWSEWVSGMPRGLPDDGDEGLDRTDTWGRTYWGGALFCLLADVAIREQSHNRSSLRTAARAIVDHGGNITVDWPIERVLDVGDAATGGHALRETYERMATHPYPVDLPALWRRLGVVVAGERVTFDDRAPLAYVRREMVRSPRVR